MDLCSDKQVGQILSLLKSADSSNGAVNVSGSWGSYAHLLAGHVNKVLKRPVLFVSSHIEEADNSADDLTLFAGRAVDTLPAWEAEPQFADATDEIGAERLRIVMELASRRGAEDFEDVIISASVPALCQPVPSPGSVEDRGLLVTVNQTIEPELVCEWLTDSGFERVENIDMPGQYAQRGGIIDVYAPITMEDTKLTIGDSGDLAHKAEAVRVEFFGDSVESIRRVDIDSQRSTDELGQVNIIPPISRSAIDQTELFINLVPENCIIVLNEPTDIQETAELFLDRVDNSEGLYPWKAIFRAMGRFTLLNISRFAENEDCVKVNVGSAVRFEHKTGTLWSTNKKAVEELIGEAVGGLDVLLYCENTAEVKRVTEIINEVYGSTPSNFRLPLGYLHHGFIVESLKTILIGHHEVFGQQSLRRRAGPVRATTAVDSFADLQKGDYVVHVSYGIGRYRGIKSITKNNVTNEYLTLEFAGKVLIHVPAHNIHLVHKYVGSSPKRPPLSRIGSRKWENQKQKVANSIREMADELLEIQAAREKLGGIAYGADSTWQDEFEECFPYQETPDQLTCIEQIKTDMQKPMPMDRLLCGDVGYGKTELAMRAAFKAVENGKQVAVLVPTTVLCVQHGRTFASRFADFPVVVEILNRFKTAKQVKDIVSRMRMGKVDIVIGTHRLLSKDVEFRDLGLLIIDEEQRFGVAHKERLKKLRVNVDILTMTATPIPRTLHMSLLGLRNISSLTTAPMDRRSITTAVCKYDAQMIKRAVYREINRQGQVFFLHNRVQSIQRMADELKELFSDLRIDIAHGQMTKSELETAMINFVVGATNILVCTTIIESGLDIPNANTIFINDADRFGLSELHQLRGRVGRYKHKAYAYMLLPRTRTITPVAAKRLKAIEEYSELGAGFRIALRDLEIRGAGNILGPEQSGHIQIIGYEMYCRLLSDAVRRMQNLPEDKPSTTVIDLGIATYIPKKYIPSDRQRMGVYRRISTAREVEDLSRLRDELADMYGRIPGEVEQILDLAQLRVLAGKWKIKSIVLRKPDVIFSLEDVDKSSSLFSRATGKVSIPDPNTVYLRLEERYFEPGTLIAVLRKLLSTKG